MVFAVSLLMWRACLISWWGTIFLRVVDPEALLLVELILLAVCWALQRAWLFSCPVYEVLLAILVTEAETFEFG